MVRMAKLSIHGNHVVFDHIKDIVGDNTERLVFKEQYCRIYVDIYDYTPEYSNLFEFLKINNITYSDFGQRIYTKDELKNSCFYSVGLNDPWEKDGWEKSFEYYGNTMLSCNLVNGGRDKVGILKTDINKIMKYDIVYFYNYILISNTLKDLLVENNFNELRYELISDYKNRELPQFYILYTNNFLPKMNSETLIKYDDEVCEFCNQKYLNTHSEIVYDREVMGVMKDFNFSSEVFTNMHIPQFIISNKVKRLFDKHKILGRPKVGMLEPIRFV